MTRQEILAVAKPILFNTDMVRAILDNRKTATRRVIKPQPCDRRLPCQPGDYLYVRETWCKLYHLADDMCTPVGGPCYYYAADGYNPTPFNSFPDEDGFFGDRNCPRWRPSIHMPKEAARIFLRVTKVRAERLWDMAYDADEQYIAEGFQNFYTSDGYLLEPAIVGFVETWDSTIKPADLPLYGWAANPWVWVIEFERITPKEAN